MLGTFLLQTELKVRTVSFVPSFSPLIYRPSAWAITYRVNIKRVIQTKDKMAGVKSRLASISELEIARKENKTVKEDCEIWPESF